MKESPYVITISRQLGSGGAYLGRRLATRLNVLYLDHEIVYQAAKELQMPEKDLASRDEKLTSRWQSLLKSLVYSYPGPYVPPPLDIPSDKALYNTETEIITRVAQEHSAVVVGRCGFHVLRRHPRHFSIFLHADIIFRQQRVQELYHVSAQQALKLIESVDSERGRYLRTFTGKDWTDARQYYLSLDTSAVGLDGAEDIIKAALRCRLGDAMPGN
jgi:cytidylate kinase